MSGYFAWACPGIDAHLDPPEDEADREDMDLGDLADLAMDRAEA